jgi:hypothetical protein
MKILTHTQRRGFVAAMMVLQLASTAAAEDGGDEGRRRRGPPAEALDACSNAEEGAACSFQGRRDREVSGICELRHDDVVCVPEGRRRRGRPDDDSQT